MVSLFETIKIIFIIVVIGASVYLIYHFKTIKEKSQMTLLEMCLSMARDRYIIDWNNSCKRVKGAKECDLPLFLSRPIEKRYQQAKDDCLKKYPEYSQE